LTGAALLLKVTGKIQYGVIIIEQQRNKNNLVYFFYKSSVYSKFVFTESFNHDTLKSVFNSWSKIEHYWSCDQENTILFCG